MSFNQNPQNGGWDKRDAFVKRNINGSQNKSHGYQQKPFQKNAYNKIKKNAGKEGTQKSGGFLLHGGVKNMFSRATRAQMASRFSKSEGSNALGISPGLRVIPMGGLEQVGGNMTVFEHKEDILVVDIGTLFADEEYPGADHVLPDISYLVENKHRIRGIVITHGHLDHIGGVRFLLPKLGFPPVYAGKFAAGLIRHQLKEARLEGQTSLTVIDPDKDILKFGNIKVGCYRNSHSIPDGFGLAIKTDAGTIIWSGDFKFDATPMPGDTDVDVERLQYFVDNAGGQVLAGFADSTNVEKPGHSPSESQISQNLADVISEMGTGRRVIMAMFSSLVMRMQGVLDTANKQGRKVFISGRSMENNIRIAQEEGIITVPPGVLAPMSEIGQYSDEQILMITTGSQGEEMSALARMARGDHKDISVGSNDLVIFSSSQIPGNERSVSKLMDKLGKQGAEIVYNKVYGVHAGGHAQEEDLRRFHDIVKPKYIVPIHGEYHMLQHHRRVAMSMGWNYEDVLLMQNGLVTEFRDGKLYKMQDRIKTGVTLVHGDTVGEVGESVIWERVQMSTSGMFVIMVKVRGPYLEMFGHPEIITRGFVYVQSSQDLIQNAADIAQKLYREMDVRSVSQLNDYKNELHKKLARYFQKELDRTPLITPVVIRT